MELDDKQSTKMILIHLVENTIVLKLGLLALTR